MGFFNRLPEELHEVFFNESIGSKSPDQLSTRDVDRYFAMSPMLFTCKKFTGLFFKNVKNVHLNGLENLHLRLWKQVISFVRRCGENLERLTLEYINFHDKPIGNSVSEDDGDAEGTRNTEECEEWEGLNLPNLKSLKIASCSGEESMKILKAVSQHNLQELHLDMGYVKLSPQGGVKDFLSTELLKYLQVNQCGLQHLELIGLPIERACLETQLDGLFGNLESLSLLDLRFDYGSTATDMVVMLKQKCTKLSSLSLRLEYVSFELISAFCISQRRTLQNLRLSQESITFGESMTHISDSGMIHVTDECRKLTCLEIGGSEHINTEGESIAGPLTSKWVEHAVDKIGNQLEILGMSFVEIDQNLLTKMAMGCGSIRSLCFNDCTAEIDCTEELLELVENVKTSLEKLEVRSCDWIRDEQLRLLRSQFKNCSLRVLQLCNLEYDVTRDELVNVIKDCGRNLKELDVYGCYDGEESPLPVLDAVLKTCDPDKLERLTFQSAPEGKLKELTTEKVAGLERVFDHLVIEEVREGYPSRRDTVL